MESRKNQSKLVRIVHHMIKTNCIFFVILCAYRHIFRVYGALSIMFQSRDRSMRVAQCFCRICTKKQSPRTRDTYNDLYILQT